MASSCCGRCPLCVAEHLPPLTSIQWGNSHRALHDLGVPPLFEVSRHLGQGRMHSPLGARARRALAHAQAPPSRQVQEYVWTLVTLLDLEIVDLVVAVYIFELCAHDHRGLFNVNVVRRFFLGCCVIARKTNTDACS